MEGEEKQPLPFAEDRGHTTRSSDGNKLINRKRQKQVVWKAFYGVPKTMLQVAIETGIMRSNITWYVNDFLKEKSIALVKSGICPITKFRAGFYTTDPSYIIASEHGRLG